MAQLLDAELQILIRNSDEQVISVLCESLHNVIKVNNEIQTKNMKKQEKIFIVIF